jgi:hypothetical protein
MGLDMYLKASRYVSGWDFDGKDQVKNFSDILEKMDLDMSDVKDGNPSMTISVTVGYWRKANAIHKWFVDNVQEGRDECQTTYVTRDQLKGLKTLCLEVLVDNSKANTLLPPQSGFFFGSTAIDEWYLDDLKQTVRIIDRCLSDKFKRFSFEYRSSW